MEFLLRYQVLAYAGDRKIGLRELLLRKKPREYMQGRNALDAFLTDFEYGPLHDMAKADKPWREEDVRLLRFLADYHHDEEVVELAGKLLKTSLVHETVEKRWTT